MFEMMACQHDKGTKELKQETDKEVIIFYVCNVCGQVFNVVRYPKEYKHVSTS